MKAFTTFSAVCVAVVVMAAMGALAEVTVSVTLTGPIDELLPILEHLREMGVGAAGTDDEALKLEMHSVATPEEKEEAGQPTAAEPPAPPQPAGPSLAGFTMEPAVARVGEKLWMSILVLNGVGIVDTVSAMIGGMNTQFELHDNGENGDPVAGDGQWSAEIMLDPQLPAGQIPLNIVAFDANGQPVKVKDPAGQPVDLVATMVVEVAK
ncbi:MAG TPA: choice-of-anchor X domain-containing protein [Candidatus Bathyarchaeia archaeon]|nr:choice-of-anchor X domain-containing protein [Candidatus Bathyarchaeia archaeon]